LSLSLSAAANGRTDGREQHIEKLANQLRENVQARHAPKTLEERGKRAEITINYSTSERFMRHVDAL